MGAAYSSLGRTKVLYATSLVLLGAKAKFLRRNLAFAPWLTLQLMLIFFTYTGHDKTFRIFIYICICFEANLFIFNPCTMRVWELGNGDSAK